MKWIRRLPRIRVYFTRLNSFCNVILLVYEIQSIIVYEQYYYFVSLIYLKPKIFGERFCIRYSMKRFEFSFDRKPLPDNIPWSNCISSSSPNTKSKSNVNKTNRRSLFKLNFQHYWKYKICLFTGSKNTTLSWVHSH